MTKAIPGSAVNDLLAASDIRLFGRTIKDIDFEKSTLIAAVTNKQLLASLKESKERLKLARIYAFSFEGQFHTLPKPTIFLVEGDGAEAKTDMGFVNKSKLDLEGFRVWKSDKDEVTLRADIVIGTLDDILIDATLSPTPKHPITSRAGTPQEASWRDGQMIARNRLQ